MNRKELCEELNFLDEELKKINTQIVKLGYGSGVLEDQTKLWGLKGKIEEKISMIDDC